MVDFGVSIDEVFLLGSAGVGTPSFDSTSDGIGIYTLFTDPSLNAREIPEPRTTGLIATGLGVSWLAVRQTQDAMKYRIFVAALAFAVAFNVSGQGAVITDSSTFFYEVLDTDNATPLCSSALGTCGAYDAGVRWEFHDGSGQPAFNPELSRYGFSAPLSPIISRNKLGALYLPT